MTIAQLQATAKNLGYRVRWNPEWQEFALDFPGGGTYFTSCKQDVLDTIMLDVVTGAKS